MTDEPFATFVLKAVSELRDYLQLDEMAYTRVAGPDHADPRRYVLFGTLDEVEKTAHQLARLETQLSDSPDQTGEVLPRLTVQRICEEQHVRARHLLEVLVLLILFSTTNEPDFYRHLLLLREANRFIHASREFDDFPDKHSKHVSLTLQRLASDVKDVESRIDLGRAWYLRSPMALNAANPAVAFSSMRERVKLALELATPLEKLSLDMSYSRGFGRSNQGLHFDICAGVPVFDEELRQNVHHLRLIALCVIRRCLELLERPRVSFARQLDRAISGNVPSARFIERYAARDVNVGDFVVVLGHLAEVEEIATSEYGYRAYLVAFLSDRPVPEVSKDWFLAHHVKRLSKFEQLVDNVRGLLAKFPSSGHLPEGQQLRSAIRGSIVDAWEQKGLREYVRTQLYSRGAGPVSESTDS